MTQRAISSLLAEHFQKHSVLRTSMYAIDENEANDPTKDYLYEAVLYFHRNTGAADVEVRGALSYSVFSKTAPFVEIAFDMVLARCQRMKGVPSTLIVSGDRKLSSTNMFFKTLQLMWSECFEGGMVDLQAKSAQEVRDMLTRDRFLDILKNEGVAAWNTKTRQHCHVAVSFANCNLEGLQMPRFDSCLLDFRSSSFRGSNMANGIMSNTQFAFCDFSGVDLTDARLVDSSFCGANFDGAVLRNANLFRANVSGAKLGNADLTDAFMAGVKYDQETEFPDCIWQNHKSAKRKNGFYIVRTDEQAE